MELSIAAADVVLPHQVAGRKYDHDFMKYSPAGSRNSAGAPPKLGAYPAPAKGAHGYGHGADRRSGHERVSGDSRAHRIGKR